MKKTILLITLIIAFAAAIPASAQFRFGLKAGFNANSLKFDNKLWSSDNRVGFTGGAMIEFTVPVVGIGLDASAMYVRRTAKFMEDNDYNARRDYIDIPVNLKYKLNLPAVNKIIRPYLATGPSFAFLVGKNEVADAFKNKKCDVAWNFGFGVELVQHVQIGASYGLGLTKTLEVINVIDNKPSIEGKNKYWTVTAAYLF